MIAPRLSFTLENRISYLFVESFESESATELAHDENSSPAMVKNEIAPYSAAPDQQLRCSGMIGVSSAGIKKYEDVSTNTMPANFRR